MSEEIIIDGMSSENGFIPNSKRGLTTEITRLKQENEFLIKKYEASLKNNEAKTLNWLEFQGCKKENERLKQENEELKAKIETYVCSANCHKYKEAEKLKQENEELKARQIKSLGFVCDCEENAKYKQALEEIREHLKSVSYLAPSSTRNLKHAIEDIINEVLDER